MATKHPKKGEAVKSAPSEKGDHAAAAGTDKKPEPGPAGEATATDGDRRMSRLLATASAAIVLSIAGIVIAATQPMWSPKLYGDSVSARIFVLSVAQLRPALESDAPFSFELATLRSIAADDTEIRKTLETIAEFSESGVPTVPQLRSAFVRLANEIMLREIVDSNRGWFDRLMLSVASTLHLHAVTRGLETGDPSAQIVMRAQTALQEGDLTGAIAALGALSGRPAELAKPWIKAANARIAAIRVLKLLDTVATSRLSSNRSLFLATY